MSHDQFSASPADPSGRQPGAGAPPPAPEYGTPPPVTDPHDTTVSTPQKPTARERTDAIVKKSVIGLIIAALLVVTYFILAAFLPRWWAGQIGNRVDGSMSSGVWTGLVLGIVCTFVPVLLFVFAFLSRRRLKWVPTIGFAVLGVLVAIPNLLTLTVVAGGGSGAHAGERIFDVEAPGFRAATAWGVIIGVVLAIVVGYFIWRYRRRGRQLQQTRQKREA
ncbi:hypothetical protein IA539_15055 [Gordonia sp. zg691]|uniref:Permease n=1 Tax=Gordonia jinghuaiqii TaxID=2758710 RepID=A0A7D7R7X2_9ACTN|nr:hypothetical protein [Gordonia jinghuaiqii]MBD0862522.1 hypothetical protein [Gordonia jinghuaiqii]MCR5976623.1 hypothetical protein [Gordonia jinghuaiqii]QMS99809.1 hypothetical protein H1R19_12485 [Gordonia jinghuaiqii]